MSDTEQDKELRECFSCKKQKIVNEHWLCSECKSEIRTIDDTWLVQEFRKWYSDDEVAEAINQIKQTILFENDTLITADRKRVALEARISELKMWELPENEIQMVFANPCNICGHDYPKLRKAQQDRLSALKAQQEEV